MPLLVAKNYNRASSKETPTITDHIICHSEIYYWQLHSIQNRPRRGELSSIESQKVIINRMNFFLLFLAGAEMKRCTSSYFLLHNRWVIIIIACWRRRKRRNGRIYIAFDFIVAAKETPVIAPPTSTKSLEATNDYSCCCCSYLLMCFFNAHSPSQSRDVLL